MGRLGFGELSDVKAPKIWLRYTIDTVTCLNPSLFSVSNDRFSSDGVD